MNEKSGGSDFYDKNNSTERVFVEQKKPGQKPEEPKEEESLVSKIVKKILLFAGIIIGVIILMAICKIFVLAGIYNYFLALLQSSFGMDTAQAKPISVIVTALSLLIPGYVLPYLFLGRKIKEFIFAVVIVATIYSLAAYFGTSNVFFDRTTGLPDKYYAITLEGYVFSSTENYDSKLGIKYRPVTNEVAKEYYLWKRTGQIGKIPEVEPGKYFNSITGEPVVWYIKRDNGDYQLFSLPGYDPLTGDAVLPITKKIVKLLIAQQDKILRDAKREEEKAKAKIADSLAPAPTSQNDSRETDSLSTLKKQLELDIELGKMAADNPGNGTVKKVDWKGVQTAFKKPRDN